MSTDEERRRAAREEQDALSAVRLAAMNRRLGKNTASMLPIIVLSHDRYSGCNQAKAFLLEDKVIFDEDLFFMTVDGKPCVVAHRGDILPRIQFRMRVPEWFLDGGSPS